MVSNNHFKLLKPKVSIQYKSPFFHFKLKKSFPCKTLIFIQYDNNVEFECKEISKLTAFENLIPDSWISSLSCYQLTYSNNELMIDSVRELFKDDI
tara:strand:- start:60220 stop:60507 length:288 start_codon:yes stop_codon:yes gene_type:complete